MTDSTVAITWFTWWVGDSTGVLLVAPLLLAFVGELKQLDVSGVEATDVATEARNAWREDVPEPGLARDVALANAPLARHEQFAVPKVIE